MLEIKLALEVGMRKLILLLVLASTLIGCAADVAISSGIAAEQKKQEVEQADDQKEQILNGIEEQRKQEEERKNEIEDI